MSKDKGIVYNIQRYTIHDGPGIRTEVFFKGCPMHCMWCSNPESLNPKPELGIYPDKCMGIEKCGLCRKACPFGEKDTPLIYDDVHLIGVNRDKCTGCMTCVDTCYTKCLKAWGEEMEVDELLDAVLKDRSYFQKSGGGITVNGGEITVQWEFVVEVLKASKAALLNTCVETALCAKPEIIKAFYPYTDLMITDLKFIDSTKQKYYCGLGNEQILSNIKMVVADGIPLIIRIPIIPGINNDEENIRATAEFIRDELNNNVVQVQLLPYRKMGVEKYDSLNMEYPMPEDFVIPEREDWERNILHLVSVMSEEYGNPAVAGSSSTIPIAEWHAKQV
jgi:pyruvate formate lyase activating enzyme